MIRPFGPEESLSIFSSLEDSSDCWIPHHQSESWQPHEDCLVVGDEGDGTVSGFVLRPLGGPGLPYFQSVFYPWVWERSRISPSPPPFPPWLVLFPLHTLRCHVPSILLCSHNVGVDSGPCFPLITTSSTFCTIWCPPFFLVSLSSETQDGPKDSADVLPFPQRGQCQKSSASTAVQH